MKFTRQGIKWQQVIALAMIAVPWFLRDELAGKMEQRSTNAQQVLTEKDEQQEQQQQISDQRDMLRRIEEIHGQLKLVNTKLDPKVTEKEIENQARQSDDKSMGGFFKGAGSDLGDSADKLDELMQQVKLTSDQENKLSSAAAAAHETAKSLESLDPNATEQTIDALFEGLSKVQHDLVDAYDTLSNVAEQERNQSTKYANWARGLAWAFTAIGTALMSNWKKLLGVSGEEEEDDKK